MYSMIVGRFRKGGIFMRRSEENTLEIQEIKAIDTILDLALQMARSVESHELESALGKAKKVSEENLKKVHRSNSAMNILMI